MSKISHLVFISFILAGLAACDGAKEAEKLKGKRMDLEPIPAGTIGPRATPPAPTPAQPASATAPAKSGVRGNLQLTPLTPEQLRAKGAGRATGGDAK
jgi:hypothetical protein